VASEESHMKVRTPRHPSTKPRSPREKRAGTDSVVADAVVAAAEESKFLRPFFDALPSPPPSLNAVDEAGPEGEKSPLWAAARRTGERGEDGISLLKMCSRPL